MNFLAFLVRLVVGVVSVLDLSYCVIVGDERVVSCWMRTPVYRSSVKERREDVGRILGRTGFSCLFLFLSREHFLSNDKSSEPEYYWMRQFAFQNFSFLFDSIDGFSKPLVVKEEELAPCCRG